nr:MAG TPA: hypothetical protein [Crassvirales sp.]
MIPASTRIRTIVNSIIRISLAFSINFLTILIIISPLHSIMYK